MKKTNLFNASVSFLIIVSFMGCNLTFNPSDKQSYLDSNVNTVVSKVIDEQMNYVKPNLEPELQASIDGDGTKALKPLKGNEIVKLTLDEDNGESYIDFCYDVNSSTYSVSSADVMDSARDVMTDQQYHELEMQVKAIEKRIQDWGDLQAKDLPIEQQHDFYKDLKTLVTRTIVLLVAGVVYAVMPDVIFWGKVSAAAAISVGAGLVALASMTIYEKYKFDDETVGPEEGQTMTDWLKKLVEQPEADYALTTTVVTLATTFGQGPVVTGILICVFGALQAWDLIATMMKKYDFGL